MHCGEANSLQTASHWEV